MGRKPYCGTARPYPGPAELPNGIPGIPAASAGGGAVIGVPPNVEASGLVNGAGAVQLGGTDSGPIKEARPRPADTEEPAPPRPAKLERPRVPSPAAADGAASAATSAEAPVLVPMSVEPVTA